jgi:hypothetical protein
MSVSGSSGNAAKSPFVIPVWIDRSGALPIKVASSPSEFVEMIGTPLSVVMSPSN